MNQQLLAPNARYAHIYTDDLPSDVAEGLSGVTCGKLSAITNNEPNSTPVFDQ